jgi:competence protein ComEC
MKLKAFFHLLVIIAFIMPATAAAARDLRVHFLSVGYADSILIEMPDKKNVLIDCGTAENALLINEYLRKLNIDTINVLVITHPHPNHYGSLPELLKDFRIEKIYFNNDWRHVDKDFYDVWAKIQFKSIPEERLVKGSRIELSNRKIKLLAVSPSWYVDDANANSVSLLLTYGKTSFLFTSDIQPLQQDQIALNFPEIGKADLIQIPHHGGKISQLFKEKINKGKKKILIISTGENRFGKPETDQLDGINGTILRTDKAGTIIISSDGKNVRYDE